MKATLSFNWKNCRRLLLRNPSHWMLQVQKNLRKHIPEIIDVVSRVGTDELGLDPMSLNDTDTFLILKA